MMIPALPDPTPADLQAELQTTVDDNQALVDHYTALAAKRPLKEFEQNTLAYLQDVVATAQDQLTNFAQIQADLPPKVLRPTWRIAMKLWNDVQVWVCLQCGTPTVVLPDQDFRDTHDQWCPNKPQGGVVSGTPTV